MSNLKPWVWAYGLFVQIKKIRSFGRRLKRKITGIKPDGFDVSVPKLIPKTIWIYWDQGEDAAPDVVKMCIASWRIRNPNWDIKLLTADNLAEYIDLPELSPQITIQAFTNLVRCRLLKRYGGVWADATSFCVRPLDAWLPVVAQQGFFCYFWTKSDQWFMWPGYFRHMATWFLASEPGGEIISTWEKYSFDYWDGRLNPHLYFWTQTLFEFMLYLRPAFRRANRDVPKLGAVGAHIVHDCVRHNRDIDTVARVIADGAAPVQKLSWRWDEARLRTTKILLLGPDGDELTQDQIVERLSA